LVSPNWPSDDDPDYTPDFDTTSSSFDIGGSDNQDLDALREELDDIVADE
jgi:hypothetical protein